MHIIKKIHLDPWNPFKMERDISVSPVNLTFSPFIYCSSKIALLFHLSFLFLLV